VTASCQAGTAGWASPSSLARRRDLLGRGRSPSIFAMRSATETPSVWLAPPCTSFGRLASGSGLDLATRPRSHGAAPGAGRVVRVSRLLVPLLSERRRPAGETWSPSLMSYRPSDSEVGYSSTATVHDGALVSLAALCLLTGQGTHPPLEQTQPAPHRTETS
jgi:hypothetical protein